MNEELFRQTIDKNHGRIYRICTRYFTNPEDAHDACQDILLKIWLNINKFRGEANINTWIFRIAVNVCLTTLNASKRKNQQLMPDSDVVCKAQVVEEMTDKGEEEKKLQFFQRFLERLTTADRTLVNLYLEDLDTTEMAAITGLSESNVRTRIHRIKKQIKTEWEEKNGTR